MAIDSIMNISESGLDFQRARVETIAANIANAGVTKAPGASAYKPMEVIAQVDPGLAGSGTFEGELSTVTRDINLFSGVGAFQVAERSGGEKLIFDPNHPHANADGFVALPDIDPVVEMTNLVAATRAYEANVRVLNAAKFLAMKALELGE